MNMEKFSFEFSAKYEQLQKALQDSDIEEIKRTALDVHAMVHPAAVSGLAQKTIADYVLDCVLDGHQNDLVPRKIFQTDLHYDGSDIVPMVWQL